MLKTTSYYYNSEKYANLDLVADAVTEELTPTNHDMPAYTS